MSENSPQKIIEKTRNDYNLIAKEWDLSRNRPSKIKTNLIHNVKCEDKVLDIGCGNALMLPLVLEKGAFYFGLDISENLVEIARKKYAEEVKNGKAKFVVGQATDIPFENEKFDFIISFATLHHIPSEKLRKIFFEEIKRVLKPNAKAKITVWNLYNEWVNNRFQTGIRLAENKSRDTIIPWKATRGKIINRYVHQFFKKELLSFAEDAGFRNIKINFFDRAGKKVKNGEEIVLEMDK